MLKESVFKKKFVLLVGFTPTAVRNIFFSYEEKFKYECILYCTSCHRNSSIFQKLSRVDEVSPLAQ